MPAPDQHRSPTLSTLDLPADGSMEALGRLITRYPDSVLLDLVARKATFGQHGAEELLRLLRHGAVRTDRSYLAYTAWFYLAIDPSPARLRAAAEVFDHAFTGESPPQVLPLVYDAYVRTLFLTGGLTYSADGKPLRVGDGGPPLPDRSQARPETWWATFADSANPYRPLDSVPTTGTPEREWLTRFSAPFTDHGLSPLGLLPANGATPFQRLTSSVPRGQVDGPLVSVIMPVYNPDESLETAVRSILDQTYANLELLIIDDASTTGDDLITAQTDRDARIRLVRQVENRGAYVARNLGLIEARGEYVTFQDADDFSHPERLARQVAHLQSRPVTAVFGHAIRAQATLMATAPVTKILSQNLSSFMFAREEVLGRIGGFDSVRRAADSEYLERLRAVYGETAVLMDDAAYGVVQLTAGSLSRGEMGTIRRHPARAGYHATAQAWHARELAHGREPTVALGERAPFPAPPHITGSPSVPGRCEVLYLGPVDASLGYDAAPAIAALATGGVDVGVLEYVGPQAAAARPMAHHPTVGPLLLPDERRSGQVSLYLPGQEIAAGIAIIHDPLAVLTMPADVLERVTVATFILPTDRFLAPDVIRNIDGRLRILTGARTGWLPATEEIAAHVRAAHPGTHVFAPAPWRAARHLASPSPAPNWEAPVVGFLGDTVGDWDPLVSSRWPVDRGEQFPRTPRAAVWGFGATRIRVHDREITRIPARLRHWENFLRHIDVLITPSLTSITEPVLDAWAAGTLLLAPQFAQETFGPGALYLGGEYPSMDDLLTSLQRDPRPADAAREAGRRYVDEHATGARLVRIFHDLTGKIDTMERDQHAQQH